MFPSPHEDPESLAEQRASNELIKRIRKLRWIGMEDEARKVQSSLRSIPSRDAVLAGPRDTD
jgi:hypothetical protein